MDCRDFRVESVKYPHNTNYLQEMVILQKELLGKYVDIESLPTWPVDINTKEAQILLKDFNARIIEELGEAMESYLTIIQSPHIQHDRDQVKHHVSNFNEELADALHFFLELLIYSNVNIKSLFPPDEDFENIDNDLEVLTSYVVHRYPPVKELLDSNGKIPHLELIGDEIGDGLLQGGIVWNQTALVSMKTLLWDITYWLQMARNTLKNKPWKQTGMLTDELKYHSYLRTAFMNFLEFYYYVGISPRHIYQVYYRKNKVNQFRQESNY